MHDSRLVTAEGFGLLFVPCLAFVFGCAAPAPQALYDDAGLVYDASTLVSGGIVAKPVVVAMQEPGSDDLVCRKEARIGSHRSRRVCFTRAQLDEITRQAQLWMRTGGFEGGPTVAR